MQELFLLPKESALKEFGGKHRSHIDLSEFINVKEEYGISIQAVAKRLHNLGIINDSLYKNFNITVSKRKWKVKEPGEYKNIEKLERFKNLVHRAVAEGIISMGKAASLLNTTIDNLDRTIQIVI